MVRNLTAVGLVLASLLLTATALHARGETPPPPPFIGGNAGSWLGDGPIFGFDTLGGPGGGWGGGWFGGGWGGWGSGFGGGLLDGGSGSGGGSTGHLYDTTKKDGHGGLHGTCWEPTPVGGYHQCQCEIKYDVMLPPCHGCPVHGFCKPFDDPANGICVDVFDQCTGRFP